MPLATRCTQCGTIFRVVQDQLKVSEGWVRCGRCQDVFNALQNLFDLGRETPPAWPPEAGATLAWGDDTPLPVEAELSTLETPREPARMPERPLLHTPSRDDDGDTTPPPSHRPAPIPASAPVSGPVRDPAFDSSVDATFDATFDTPFVASPAAHSLLAPVARRADDEPAFLAAPHLHREPVFEPHAVADADDPAGFADARFNIELLDDDAPSPASAALAALQAAPAEPAPSFLRQADRAARWRRPGVRAALVGSVALGLVVLAAQVGLHWRSPIAATWPATRLALEPLCALAGCRIEPPRRLDSLVVENSGLAKLATPGQYRLSVSLRNRSPMLVMVPSVELTLTDPLGQLLSRKALSPADLGTRVASLAPGAELPLQTLLSTGDLHGFGYTVEIFYP